MSEFIPLSVPNISSLEIEYVTKALKDGWVSSSGPDIERFEELFAEFCGCKYAVACSSGTSALHVSLLVAGVKDGDEVIVPDISFVATANAVKYCGAQPVFCDINLETLGLDIEKLNVFLSTHFVKKSSGVFNKSSGRKLSAIVPVHMLGTPVDMSRLMEITNEWQIPVVEDSAESLGSRLRGEKLGVSGDFGCYSFNGNKILTTGGGGMIVTNNKMHAKRAKHLTTTAKTDPINYFHDETGFNYRLVNLLAALGLAQLQRIDEFLEKKYWIHSEYRKRMSAVTSFSLYSCPEYCDSNYWLNLVSFTPSDENNLSVSKIVDLMSAHRIQCRPFWSRLSTLPMYTNCFTDSLSVSTSVSNSHFMIPSGTTLNSSDITRVCEVLSQIKV